MIFKNTSQKHSNSKITVLGFLSFFILFFIFSNNHFIVFGQNINKKKINRYSLKNPYETITTHLLFLDKRNYNPSIAGMAFLHEGMQLKDAILYAKQLKDILTNEGVYINMDSLPQDANYVDPVKKLSKYKLSNVLPQIYLVKVDNKWIYSNETINSIPILYKKISRYNIYKIGNLFSKKWKKSFFGIYMWQYFLFGMVLLFSKILYLFLQKLLNVVSRKILKYRGFDLAVERYMRHIKSINKYLIRSFIFFTWLIVIRPALQLPITISRYTVVLFKSLLLLNLSLFFYKLVDGVLFYITRGVVEEKFEFHIDLIPLVRKVLKVCIVIIFSLFLLKILNYDVSAILTSLSLGSLGLALASQDTLKNLFGSVMIFIDKPFGVGDMIVTKVVAKDLKGRVEEIGMRSTILRTPDQSQIHVPNALLANSYIENKGLNTHEDFSNILYLPADVSIDKVHEFIDGFRDIISAHPKALNAVSNVNLSNIDKGNFEIVYTLFFKKSSTYYKELSYRHEVLTQVISLAETLKINLKLS